MSITGRLIRAASAFAEQRSTLANPNRFVLDFFSGGGADTYTGKTVNATTSMNYSAYYSAVLILAETMASLPVGVFRKRPDGFTEPATDHPLWPILHDAPNEEMTSTEFRGIMQGHLASWGNAYAQKRMTGGGRVESLWPLRPDRMEVRRDRTTRRLAYEYQPDSGPTQHLTRDDVLHLRGFGFDGIKGYSTFSQGRQAIAMGMTAEEFGGRFFANAASTNIALRHPGVLGKEAKENLIRSLQERHVGTEKAWKPLILEENMGIEQVGVPPEDAQLLQLRGHQVEEIARIFRIPPHMLQHLDRATFNNIAELGVGFLTYTMLPWIKRWDEGLWLQLLSPPDRRQMVIKHNVRGLLRGNLKDQAQYYKDGRQWGWLSVNDIRRLEDMPPVEGGDAHHSPLNMAPLNAPPAQSGDGRGEPGPVEQRSGAARHRLSQAFRGVFEEQLGKLVAEETKLIRKDGLPRLGRREAGEFNTWIDNFYRLPAVRELISRSISPALDSYAQAIGTEVSEEINAEPDMAQAADFGEAYRATFVDRWAGSSSGQLRKLVSEAEQAGEDAVEAVEQRLSDWKETRAEQTSRNEVVRFGNALSKALFVGAGFLKLMWRTVGENCPICDELNGVVVSVSQSFVAADETLNPEGAQPFTSRSRIGHPPLHKGCDCMITPA